MHFTAIDSDGKFVLVSLPIFLIVIKIIFQQVLLAMQKREIAGNLHFNSPNTEIPALSDGRIKVIL